MFRLSFFQLTKICLQPVYPITGAGVRAVNSVTYNENT